MYKRIQNTVLRAQGNGPHAGPLDVKVVEQRQVIFCPSTYKDPAQIAGAQLKTTAFGSTHVGKFDESGSFHPRRSHCDVGLL